MVDDKGGEKHSPALPRNLLRLPRQSSPTASPVRAPVSAITASAVDRSPNPRQLRLDLILEGQNQSKFLQRRGRDGAVYQAALP